MFIGFVVVWMFDYQSVGADAGLEQRIGLFREASGFDLFDERQACSDMFQERSFVPAAECEAVDSPLIRIGEDVYFTEKTERMVLP